MSSVAQPTLQEHKDGLILKLRQGFLFPFPPEANISSPFSCSSLRGSSFNVAFETVKYLRRFLAIGKFADVE